MEGITPAEAHIEDLYRGLGQQPTQQAFLREMERIMEKDKGKLKDAADYLNGKGDLDKLFPPDSYGRIRSYLENAKKLPKD